MESTEYLGKDSRITRRGFKALFTCLIVALPLAGHTASPKVERYSKLPQADKINVNLLRLDHQVRARGLSLAAATRNMAIAEAGQGIVLDIVTNDIQPGDEYKFELPGVTVAHLSPKYNRASVVIDDSALLYELARLPEVRTIAPQYPAITRFGSVDGMGDEAMRADLARTTFAVDGTGQIVGILSDSFARTAGVRDLNTRPPAGVAGTLTGSKPQDSGDLPPTIDLRRDDLGTDEGAAMAELVSDIAPGAGIAFRAVGISEAAFADGIDDLCASQTSGGGGATVMVDDVLFLAEAMYQDDIPAQAAANCVASGVPFFSAAGNSANSGFRRIYNDVNDTVDNNQSIPVNGVDLHDFGAGRGFLPVTLPAGGQVTAILQWNQPSDSVRRGRGAEIDLDLYATSTPDAAGLARPVAASDATQGTTGAPAGDAFEGLSIRNPRLAPFTFFLAVDHFSGNQKVIPQNPRTRLQFRLVLLDLPRIGNGTSAFGGPTTWGHSMAAGVTSVGAVPFYETAAFNPARGPTPRTDPEPFTSRGGLLAVQFDRAGAFRPRTSFEPDISAVDQNNTSFFPPGNDLNLGGYLGEPDGRPNFPGTSAAAPNAAAVAALMLAKAGGALTPAQIEAVLRATAIDITGFRAARGRDDVTGAGLINAQAALARIRAAAARADE